MRTRHGFSTIFWIIIVVIVFVIAIYYYQVGKSAVEEAAMYVPLKRQDQQTKDLQKLSGSDEVSDIESDLNSTNFDSLDEGLSEVDQALVNF
ncbi:hypothetical protein HYU92_06135 [Candidatus Curtissbacteria bacterium]|nr:hypothetical protein [Candidatus Curtissbacteria bacterium]